jgi:hypothetical protein
VRLRIIDVEGTPEEIARLPQLAELLGVETDESTDSETATPAPITTAPAPGLPADVASLLGLRRPATLVAQLINRFLSEALQWPDVDARVGASRRTSDGLADAIRLHRRGSQVGAFVYLRLPSGTMLLRLPANFADVKFSHATPRKVGGRMPYGLALRLTSNEAVQEAITLAHAAYDRTLASPVGQNQRQADEFSIS